MKTRRTELARIWSQFVTIMNDNCASSTGLKALLDKDTQEVATWIVTMTSGDSVGDAHKVTSYIGMMYTLEASVQEEIEQILLTLLQLCLNS